MELDNKPRSRAEIPAESKWAIEDLYATDEAWEQAFASVAEDQQALAAFAGKLGESGDTLCAYLTKYEQTSAKLELLGNYCMRRADEDTRSAAYQAMTGRFMQGYVALGAACSFDTPEILAISDETLDAFYAACLAATASAITIGAVW